VLAMLLAVGFSESAMRTCQAQYPGRYIRGYGYSGYGGWGGGMTPQMGAGIGIGAAGVGLGTAATDIGQYQIEHQKANILAMQAYQEYLKTFGMQHDAFLKYQQENQAEYNAKVAAARAQVEAYKKDMSSKSSAHRLTSDQYDPQNKVILWPMVLRDSMFDEYRYKLDQLFHERSAANSGAASNNCAEIEKTCDAMMKQVGQDINNLNIDQFITAKHFISSLAYEARFAVR
jgi:hypothetical protein